MCSASSASEDAHILGVHSAEPLLPEPTIMGDSLAALPSKGRILRLNPLDPIRPQLIGLRDQLSAPVTTSIQLAAGFQEATTPVGLDSVPAAPLRLHIQM